MSANLKTRAIDNAVDRSGGLAWNRLHSEREDIMQVIPRCALLKQVEVIPSLEGVALDTLTPFDTICVRTRNSDYRIFLLDPKSGRGLVEGGRQFVEPVEAVVNGSTFGGSTFKVGWIGIGLRIEFLTNDHLVSTSPVQSVRVEHWTSAEPTSEFHSLMQKL